MPYQRRSLSGGPVVIALTGDVAASDLPHGSLRLPLPAARPTSAVEDALAAMAELINSSGTVAIFGGQDCAGAEAEVLALAGKSARRLLLAEQFPLSSLDSSRPPASFGAGDAF